MLTDAERFETDLRSMSRAVAADANDEGLALGLRALAAYAGDLLPEAGPADWVLSERERLRVLASSAAIEVARLARDLGRLEEGRRAAQRAVELDPLRDSAWALLAEHQEALGEPSAAAATRREHERVVAVLEGPG